VAWFFCLGLRKEIYICLETAKCMALLPARDAAASNGPKGIHRKLEE
jgi:hypothetical protein